MVNTTADERDAVANATCSLREAIQSANTDADFGGCEFTDSPGLEDVIKLGPSTYTLTRTGVEDNTNTNRDLDITEDVKILGVFGKTTIDADDIGRALDVVGMASTPVELHDLRFLDGNNAGAGGAVFADTHPLTVMNSVFESNHAGSVGGAILSSGDLDIRGSTFVGNSSVDNGGALVTFANSGHQELNRNAFLDNHAGSGVGVAGGAIYVDNIGTTMHVENSTLVGNGAAEGGGLFIEDGFVFLSNLTLSGNTATVGMGGGLDSDAGVYELQRSIFDGNTPNNCANSSSALYVAHTLENGTSCTGSVLANPMLAPLGSYGGPTMTRPPFTGSPALDAVPATTAAADCDLPNPDQRGVFRPQGGACDIGAVEGSVAPPVIQPPAQPPATPKRCKKGQKLKGGKCVKKKKKKRK